MQLDGDKPYNDTISSMQGTSELKVESFSH